MKWIDFERQLKRKGLKLFTPLDIERFLGRSKVAVTFLVHRLKKQGYIQAVKRGLYKLSDEQIPDLYLANKLYEPSYVSLESALSYHRVIPETVYEITSVSPKATRRFERLGGIYSYRKVKRAAFSGYRIEKQKGFGFRIADPEKAFVDANYFRLRDGLRPLSRYNRKTINPTKVLHYVSLFNSRKLLGMMKTALR